MYYLISLCTLDILPGVYGVDLDQVAIAASSAIQRFLQKHPDTSLRTIWLIDVNTSMVAKLNQHMMELVTKGSLRKISSETTSM